MSLPEIVVDELRLRDWRPEDRSAFVEIFNDPQVAYWLGGSERTQAAAARFEQRCADQAGRSWGVWAVEVSGQVVGAAGLQPVALDPARSYSPAIEAAWRLRSDAWGRGYATRAMRAVFAHLAPAPPASEIVAITAESNLRSQAVMTRLDFVRQPEQDFDHPTLEVGHPLRRHRLFRRRLEP